MLDQLVHRDVVVLVFAWRHGRIGMDSAFRPTLGVVVGEFRYTFDVLPKAFFGLCELRLIAPKIRMREARKFQQPQSLGLEARQNPSLLKASKFSGGDGHERKGDCPELAIKWIKVRIIADRGSADGEEHRGRA